MQDLNGNLPQMYIFVEYRLRGCVKCKKKKYIENEVLL